MTTILTDSLLTSTGLQDRHVTDMRDMIYQLWPNAAPLTVLTGRLGKETTTQPAFNWLEEDFRPYWDTLAEDVDGSETTVTVANGAYFKPGDVVRVVTTDEVMLVTGVSSNDLTVTRGFAASSASAAALTGDAIVLIGSAFAENTGAPEQRLIQEAKKTNYTQIFKRTYGVSGTQKAVKDYGPTRLNHFRATHGRDFRVDIEKAFIFGVPADAVTDSVRTTGGLLHYLTSQSYDFTDTISLANLEAMAEQGFTYGSDTKVLLAGRRLVTHLNQLAGNKIQTKSGEKTFGLQVGEYVTAHGVIDIVAHPLLLNKYSGWGFLLDMNEIKMRVLSGNGENRDVKLIHNVQANDKDGYQEMYLAEVGLEVRQAAKHLVVKSDLDAQVV